MAFVDFDQIQVFVRSPIKVTQTFPKKGLTEQHHKESCDIHHIMKKYIRTGVLEHTRQYEGQYMNMASAPDFYNAQIILANARSMFETIPAEIRADFKNDPALFLEFIQDENNRDKIIEYGFSDEHLPPVIDPAAPIAPAPAPDPDPDPTP